MLTLLKYKCACQLWNDVVENGYPHPCFLLEDIDDKYDDYDAEFEASKAIFANNFYREDSESPRQAPSLKD